MLYKNYTDLVNKLVWIIPKKSKRDNMRNILNDIVNTAYKVEYLMNKNNSAESDKDERTIIIWQSDGFTGQLGKYFIGESIKQNYDNVRIKYDITWHLNWGMDCFKKEKRIFDLTNCFPDLDIEIATKDEIEMYKRLFYVKDETWYPIDNYIKNSFYY